MACHGMPELHLIHTKDLEGGMNQRCAYRILQVQRGVSTFCQSLDTLCTGTQRKCQIVQHHIRNMSSSRARQKSAVLTVCFSVACWYNRMCPFWLNQIESTCEKCSRNSQLGEFIQDFVVRLQQRFRTLARRACKIVTYCRVCRGHVFYHEKHS